MIESACVANKLVQGLCQAVGHPAGVVPLHEPEFIGNEWKYVKECIDTGWVSSVGSYVDAFEARLMEITGAKYAVAVVNGTAALHLALRLAGVKPGDEVIVPALSFVATANAVAYCGATPHFVDCESKTLGMDPEALGQHLQCIAEITADGLRNKLTGRRIAAIVPMHTFGHPVRMPELINVATRFNIPVVEDAAESLGSSFEGRHTGTTGVMGVLSFNGNKIVTTGGGGAILTNDATLAERAKHLSKTAKKPHRWEFFHDEIGYNYRLPNLNAALGCAQLENLDSLVSRKRILAERYRQTFSDCAELLFVDEPAGCKSNFWLNAVRIKGERGAMVKDDVLAKANDAGFQCRPAWTLLSDLPMFVSCPKAELDVARMLESTLINLPSSANLAGLRYAV